VTRDEKKSSAHQHTSTLANQHIFFPMPCQMYQTKTHLPQTSVWGYRNPRQPRASAHKKPELEKPETINKKKNQQLFANQN